MTVLILLSHGSRHPGAAPGIDRLADAVASLTGLPTVPAHLELCSPSLADAARAIAVDYPQESEVLVVPLLFTQGFHARWDVPAQVAAASEASGLNLRVTRGLGTGPDMAQVLAERVTDPRAHLVVYAVGSTDRMPNTEVERLAVRLADITGQSTSVAFATRGGVNAIARQREVYPHLEILPLFVTQGLLLDAVGEDLQPLQEALAPLIARRVRAYSKVGV
ncbi:sirohydrochlorin chelatase [Corynebacterium lizhenjunii]|uniref:Sirohydrochlorin chelatase n=1 Tax=Corynebacterium lizhenjunii TaxID=2709394 RepID=A0A7T0PBQ6_9CORY|nr:CbiX/SirB N-terminal domain-containing protein [Corynebacterium lizhenjunii]QPK79680.1 sirohydrochlorin chelatase [Corynebacterium lizhenjunii]